MCVMMEHPANQHFLHTLVIIDLTGRAMYVHNTKH